jgi:DNA repair exonuclease SbcCD ATPase subunit
VDKDTLSVSNLKTVKSLFLEGFQSHASTEVNIAPPGGLTVFCGPTDAGKTAIVRALRLALYNVPNGTDYIRVGRNQSTVALEMADGHKVVRERSRGSVNRYRVVNPGQTDGGDKYEGFGSSVPQEVVDVTGVRLVKVGEKDVALNLSEQLDGPFLGSAVSSPERARILGKLAGTEEVDEAQKALNADIYHANQDEKRLAEEVEGLETRIGEYAWLEELKEATDKAAAILETVKANQEKLDALTAARTSLNDIARRQLEQASIINRWANVDRAALVLETIVKPAAEKLEALLKLKIDLAKNRAERAAWQPILDRWANLTEAQAAYNVAVAAHEKAVALRSLSDSLIATEAGKRKAEATIQRWQGVEAAGSLVAAIEQSGPRLQDLRRLSRELRENVAAQTAQQRIITRYATVEEADKALRRAEEAAGKVVSLTTLREALTDNAKRRQEQVIILARWERLDDAAEIVAHVESKTTFLATLRQLSRDLTRNREARVVAEEDLKRKTQALTDAEQTYKDTLISLGKCPLCGSIVNPELLKEVAS